MKDIICSIQYCSMIEGKLSQWLEQAPKHYSRLFDIESARVVKQAIMDTDMKIEGFRLLKSPPVSEDSGRERLHVRSLPQENFSKMAET